MPKKLKWCPIHKEWNWVQVPQSLTSTGKKRRDPDNQSLTDILGGTFK